MHFENRLFWQRCSEKYSRYFNDPSKTIEFGSLNINGSIRDFCRLEDYTGIDWIAGPCVDLVSFAHEVPFGPGTFDTVFSASMLEHDPFWYASLTKMVDVLKKDGLFAISWGAIKNPVHHLELAPDGKFHPLKAGLVLDTLQSLGLYIHEFQYERTICFEHGDEEFIRIHKVREDKTYGMGEVMLIGFRDKAYAIGQSIMEPLIEEDRI